MNLVVSLYRLGHWGEIHRIPVVPLLVKAILQLVYCCRISASATIGKGTTFPYCGMGVLIVGNTAIGSKCSIGAGVKIVRKFPYANVPQIGDNVYIGPGAVICGPVKIGNKVIVAPNAVVVNSVPPGAIVGGVPAKIIGHESDLDYSILDLPKNRLGFAPCLSAHQSSSNRVQRGPETTCAAIEPSTADT